MKTLSTTLFSTATLAMCALLMLGAQVRSEENKAGLTSGEVSFIKQAAADGQAEVKLAELAMKKGASADVKALAETLAAEHIKTNAELTQFASAKSVDISAVIDPKAADKFQDLEKQGTGTDFDNAYIDEVVASHKKCIDAFEDISKDTKNAELKAWVDKTLPGLRAHHAKAKELDK
ncbi:DUF4142 domain-containing protein [Brevifollis gellanilyticus]|uniref:DUF4142 domain-containing protein n=1 Tax=Brevifollis gellanilyticus TaxID=748831 RepID=A0A512MAB7_9BACT|nr:DUF4142 domain-containing protein [Brevifollis gellanilyticus]GEP43685.1 hypothetical protein BGE01nite_29760 [Brevifollis gellanilyticus]